jgi:hypothetical protein
MAGVTADVDSLSFAGVDKKGPFARPLIGRKLVDTFGAPRSGGRRHEGEDIFAPEGTPIHAVAGGTIVKGFSNPLGGNVVRIQGDDGRFYYYAHLKGGTFDHLKVGQHVNAGQVIGGVGHTGDAAGTPNHLHFQVQENGEWLNPFTFLKALPELPDALAGAGVQTADTEVDPFAIDRGSPPSVAAADADQDGLMDQFEAMFGTDPKLADTDQDGLSDALETGVTHTDPLAADTDKDGLTDAFERSQNSDAGRAKIPDSVRAANFGGLATMDSDKDGLSDSFEKRAGTDPLKADSDQDGLRDGDEVARRSDPRALDSDQDGLADNFEAGQGTLGETALPAGGTGGLGSSGLDPSGLDSSGLDPSGLGSSGLGETAIPASGLEDVPDDYDVGTQ